MKIALCLSGQPRGIPLSIEETCYNVINPLNADVFIHSWYSSKCDNLPFDSAQQSQNNKVGKWTPESDSILKKEIKPKKCLFEHPKKFEEFSDLLGIESANQTKLASIFYGIYNSNKLKSEFESENNFKYDVVIRTRLDLVYKNPLKLNMIDNMKFDDGVVYAPSFYQNIRENDSYPISSAGYYSSMTDIFLVANSQTMDKVCDTYLNFREIHDKIYPHPYGETYMGYNVRHRHKINVRTFEYYMDIMHRVIKQ